MPAFFAHKAFGEEVISYLPPSFQENIKKHIHAFVLGTQGPDILFYHKPFSANDVKKKGMDLHLRSAKEFFVESAKKIARENHEEPQDSALGAYVAGFICHFWLDNACHPHIYVLEAEGVSHGRIESEFDKYLKLRKNLPVHQNAAKKLTKKYGVWEAVGQTLEVDDKSVKRSIKTMRQINGLFSSKSKGFHKLAHAVLKKMGAEEKFGGMFLHFENHPKCDRLNPVLEDKFKSARVGAAETIERYFELVKANSFEDELFEVFDKDYKGESLL